MTLQSATADYLALDFRRHWTPYVNSKWIANFAARHQGYSSAHLVFAIYTLLILPIYFLPVCTPDEAWFEHDARMFADSWRGDTLWGVLFGQSNHLGYGASYWIGYALLAKFTYYPFVLMRCFAFAANLAIPYLLLRQCRDVARKPAALCALLIWISFTAAWWTGKVTGPELFSTAFLFCGLCFLSMAKQIRAVLVAGVLVGLGVGLKSNAAPAALMALFILPHVPRPWRSLSMVFAGACAGFVLANPFVLFEPATLLANIRRQDKFGAGYTTNHLAEVMWNSSWEWEGVFRGGYFNWGMSPLAVPIYLCFLWKAKLPWTWFVGGLGCTVIGFLLYLTSRTYQGWYWLPLMSLFPLTVLQLRKVDSSTWRWAMATMLINLASNAPWIGFQYYSKFEQLAHSFERERVLDEAKQIAAAPRDGLLVTILDQGIELDDQSDQVANVPREPVSDLSGFFLLNELRYGRRELVPGETWVVIHDHRLRQYNPILDPARDLERLGPDYDLELNRGEFVTSMRIHRRLQTAKKGKVSR